jgi:hypothetical protein
VSQINVNPTPREPVDTVDTSGDRTAAAGINLITVLIVLAVLAVIAWYLFTGPLRSLSGGTTNVNVNNPPAQPAPTININPPAGGNNNPAPSTGGNTGTGSNTGGTGGAGSSTGTRP